MKLGFCPSIGFILDFECIVDCELEWEFGSPTLIVNDVFESDGKVSLFHSTDDKFWKEFALRIMAEAEDDERLLAKAVEQDEFERAAA
jgi:hypothetical protein